MAWPVLTLPVLMVRSAWPEPSPIEASIVLFRPLGAGVLQHALNPSYSARSLSAVRLRRFLSAVRLRLSLGQGLPALHHGNRPHNCLYQLATAVDPTSAASSCREFFAVSASASSRRSPPEYHNGEPTNRRPRGAATIVKPGVRHKSSLGSRVGPILP